MLRIFIFHIMLISVEIGGTVLQDFILELLNYITMIVQILALAVTLYYFVIGIFGWIPKREPKNPPKRTNTFALLVAAHDEEVVIGNMVDSLRSIDYDKDAFDILVIADNCSDRTAEIAREHGAIVYERFNNTQRGKGFALEWMFDKLFQMEKQYDYIGIFDADNLVDKNFLNAMNHQINNGYKVVQGYVDSKNPFDSWITCSYSFSFWSVSRVFQAARHNLGLSCQLSGTGFVMNTELLKKLGWGATCLTEDMEFTMKLALNDERVGWAHDAIIYDEKPLTLAQSWRQRKRWMQGHADVASRFFGKLMKKAFKEGKFLCFDCAIYLVQPIRIIALGFITLFAWLQAAYPDGNIGFFHMSYLFSPIVWNTFVILQLLYMPFVIALERKQFDVRMFFGYIAFMFYNLTWIPIAVQGMIDKNKTEWSHTKHTRQITIEEFEKQ